MSSETHTASSDGNAIQGVHEAAVGYPVNWNWFFRSDLPSSSDVTTTLLDKDYPSNHATVTTNNKSSNETQGMNDGKSNTCYQLRRNNCCSEDDVYFLLCLLALSIIFGFSMYCMSIEPAYVPPLTFKVVSLEVGSMTISNNPCSDIQKYMSAELNLTLSLMEKDQEVLLVKPLLVSIMYGDELLSSRKIDPQGEKSIELDMSIMASPLDVETGDSIATELAINHSLVLRIHIKGQYCTLKSGGRLWCDYGVAMTCDGVKVNFLLESNSTHRGSLINGPCPCKSIVD